jgi:hypothetical protein
MITEYKIFSDRNQTHLQQSVLSAIREGWQPVGGVSAVVAKLNLDDELHPEGDETIIYLQAVGR